MHTFPRLVAACLALCVAGPAWAQSLPAPSCPQALHHARTRAAYIVQPGTTFEGQGLILNAQYILTAAHVVESKVIKVAWSQQSSMASVVATHPGDDLSLLKLATPLQGFPLPLPELAGVPPVGQPIFMWSWRQTREGVLRQAEIVLKTLSDVPGHLYLLGSVGMLGDSGSGLYDCLGRLVGLKDAVYPKAISLPVDGTERRRILSYLTEGLRNGNLPFSFFQNTLYSLAVAPQRIGSLLCGTTGQPLLANCATATTAATR